MQAGTSCVRNANPAGTANDTYDFAWGNLGVDVFYTVTFIVVKSNGKVKSETFDTAVNVASEQDFFVDEVNGHPSLSPGDFVFVFVKPKTTTSANGGHSNNSSEHLPEGPVACVPTTLNG